jgi:HK97 family phage portal protein
VALFPRRNQTAVEPARPHLPGRKAATFTPDVVYTVRDFAVGASSYGALYRQQPAVRAVVDWLARNIAQLNAKVYERVGNNERIESNDHPLAQLLRWPNPATSRYAHMRDTVADIAVYDIAYWVKDRPDLPRNVVRVPPSKINKERVRDRWVYRDADGQVIPRSRLVIFRGYNPDGDDGVSPMETLRRVLREEYAAQQHRENFWRNAARQQGMIERPIEAPKWSPEARARFQEEWHAATSGAANSGRTAILEEGMRWNTASFSPKDSDYIAGRRLTYEEVALQFGLLDIGRASGSSANAAEQSHRERYQDVLGPWLRMLQDDIELQLLPSVDLFAPRGLVYVEFNLKEKLKGSFVEEQKALTTSVGVPHMTVNEGRARMNLPRIEEDWADTPVQPLNVMYGGQPAVTVPTADPGTAAAVPQMKKLVKAEQGPRDEAADEFRATLVAYFDRQERSVLPKVKAKTVVDRARWDTELAGELFTLSAQTAYTSGWVVASQLGGTYESARTREWIAVNAQRTAETVNADTFDQVDQAETTDEIRAVYEEARTNRAAKLALSLATALAGFGALEAGRHTADQGREIVKSWRVVSTKSRHPHMDGETVPVDGVFSNGGRWPGDPALGADDAAGCMCLLDIGEAR